MALAADKGIFSSGVEERQFPLLTPDRCLISRSNGSQHATQETSSFLSNGSRAMPLMARGCDREDRTVSSNAASTIPVSNLTSSDLHSSSLTISSTSASSSSSSTVPTGSAVMCGAQDIPLSQRFTLLKVSPRDCFTNNSAAIGVDTTSVLGHESRLPPSTSSASTHHSSPQGHERYHYRSFPYLTSNIPNHISIPRTPMVGGATQLKESNHLMAPYRDRIDERGSQYYLSDTDSLIGVNYYNQHKHPQHYYYPQYHHHHHHHHHTTTTTLSHSAPRIIDVWAYNLEEEFTKIRDVVERFQYIAMDTEFPGIVARPTGNCSDYNYKTVKFNVDLLKVIQLGITFADERGCSPIGTSTWQFNFKFDLNRDMYAQDSIDFLRDSGIDFATHQNNGIDINEFGELIISSGLVMNRDVKWISFHGSYDFGYLLKLLTCAPLPDSEAQFFDLLHDFFPALYDIKYLLKNCRNIHLTGGTSLQKVAEHLDVHRIGPQHQAGSDSLVTCQTFFRLMDTYFDNLIDDSLFSGIIYGLGATTSTTTTPTTTVTIPTSSLAPQPIQSSTLLCSTALMPNTTTTTTAATPTTTTTGSLSFLRNSTPLSSDITVPPPPPPPPPHMMSSQDTTKIETSPSNISSTLMELSLSTPSSDKKIGGHTMPGGIIHHETISLPKQPLTSHHRDVQDCSNELSYCHDTNSVVYSTTIDKAIPNHPTDISEMSTSSLSSPLLNRQSLPSQQTLSQINHHTGTLLRQ